MNRSPLLSALALALLATACDTAGEVNPGILGRESMWVNDALSQAQVDKAIRSQSTVFPHYFEPGSATFTPAGLDAVGVLARDLADHPRDLVLSRGSASRDLWSARVETVRGELDSRGVILGSIAVRDGVPGGEGWSTDRVLKGLEKSSEPLYQGVAGITTGNIQ